MVRHHGHRPPQGPIGLPFIGHLHMLRKFMYHTLYKLSQKYSPIIMIRLGSVPCIIVSFPDTAEIFFKTHDKVFDSHPKSQTVEYLSYGTKGMVFSKYGVYRRNVRKFCTMELLSIAKVDSMSGLRREELDLLVRSLRSAAGTGEIMDVSEKVTRLIHDMNYRMLFGKSKDDRFDLSEIIHELGELAGAFNIADYVPILSALDL
ncbi:cytochrome P450 CYP736A12-like [Apium graveolens]|uniref:cytochrome P450 CYP736A12-like n=1 Tax=Apium graveolens TaxID=4045 RepID=UPI003D79844D